MVEKIKKQRRLSKKCPECGGVLEKIEHQDIIDGVIYSKIFIECSDCDYSKDISDKRNKKEME